MLIAPLRSRGSDCARFPALAASGTSPLSTPADPMPNLAPLVDCGPSYGPSGIYNLSSRCEQVVVEDINYAHREEGVASISLPSGFNNYSDSDQFFILMNLEGVSRGFNPIFGTTAALNFDAYQGASGRYDPAVGGHMYRCSKSVLKTPWWLTMSGCTRTDWAYRICLVPQLTPLAGGRTVWRS